MQKLRVQELNRKTVAEFKKAEKIPIVAVLENIRSAYNVGSFFRTADAFLLEGIYLCGYTAHPPHKEIKKTALGAEDTVHWKHFKKTEDALADLRAQGFAIYAVEQASGSIPLHRFYQTVSANLQHQLHQKLAVIFGNEVTGVEQSTIGQTDGCIEIPQLGMKHSLNVATAGGVVLWELVRSRIDVPGR